MNQKAASTLLIRAQALLTEGAGDPHENLDRATTLLVEALAKGDYEAETVAQRAAGNAARELHRHAEAAQYLADGLAAARRHHLPHRAGEILLTRAMVYLELGDLTRARRDLLHARDKFGDAPPAEYRISAGMVAQRAGDFHLALDLFSEALNSEDRDDIASFKALSNSAGVLVEMGRLSEAESSYRSAEELATRLGPLYHAGLVHNLGWVLTRRGRLTEAMQRFEEAEGIARSAGVPTMMARLDQVDALDAAGLWDEADALLTSLLPELQSPGVALLLADALLRRATIALRQRKASEAQRDAEQAMALFKEQRRVGSQTAALIRIAQACLLVGDVSPAHARKLATALAQPSRGDLATAIEGEITLGRVHSALAQPARANACWQRASALATDAPLLLKLQGHVAEALAASDRRARTLACRRGITLLDGFRVALQSAEMRARAAVHGMELVDLAMAVQTNARSMFDWLEVGRALALAIGPANNNEELSLLLSELRRMSEELPTAIAEDEASLLQRQRRVEHRLRRQTWASSAGANVVSSRADAAGVHARLGQQIMVSIGLVGADLMAVSLYRGRTSRHDLGKAAELVGSLGALRFAARRLAGARGEAARVQVEQILCMMDAQLASMFPDAVPIIVPAPELHSLPWASLPSLSDRPVVVAPSATLWLRTLDMSTTSDRVALVAGPRLDHAAEEIATIAKLYPTSRALSVNESTCDRVTHLLDGAYVAHLACHGHMRADSPMFSSLEMSDGMLNLFDIERMRRTPHRVVLSACDSAVVSGPQGSEPLGFISALLQRETAAVVASTIPVPDEQSKDLMVRMHEELVDGLSMPEALHRARATLDTSSPAGFAASLAFTAFGAG
jgi:tetratricopeptide (TPR) repeat protein